MKVKTSRAKIACPSETESSTRRRILDAAFRAFLRRGYERTSTLEIATAAKVSKRELYAHFKNKAALFAAGIKGRTEDMRVPLVKPDISNIETLARTLEAFGISLLMGVTHPHVLAVHRLVIAESTRSPELATILDREGRGANAEALTALMRDALAANLIRGKDPKGLAAIFSSLLWGDLFVRLLLRVGKSPSPAEIRNRAHEATAMFLQLYGL